LLGGLEEGGLCALQVLAALVELGFDLADGLLSFLLDAAEFGYGLVRGVDAFAEGLDLAEGGGEAFFGAGDILEGAGVTGLEFTEPFLVELDAVFVTFGLVAEFESALLG